MGSTRIRGPRHCQGYGRRGVLTYRRRRLAVAVRQMGFGEQVSCIGGGTLLKYIEGKELPGVAALRQEQLVYAKESRPRKQPGLFGMYRI